LSEEHVPELRAPKSISPGWPSIVAAIDEAAVMLDERVPPLALMRLFVHAQNLERHDRVGRNLDVLLVILREHVTAACAERTANVRADHLTDNVADDHPANGTGNFFARVALGVGCTCVARPSIA
jgi:hypothetical protein